MKKIIIFAQFFIIFKVTSVISVHSAIDTKKQTDNIVPKLLKYPLFRQLLLSKDSSLPDITSFLLTSISIFKKYIKNYLLIFIYSFY